MLKFFGAPEARSYSARTYEELFAVLRTRDFLESATPQLLEVSMDKFVEPWTANEAGRYYSGEIWKAAKGPGQGEGTEETCPRRQSAPVQACFGGIGFIPVRGMQEQKPETSPDRTNMDETNG